MLKNQMFYCVFAQTCRTTTCFIMFSFKNEEQSGFYYVFVQKCYNNHVFYCFFARTCRTTHCFIMFSFKNEEQPGFYCVFAQSVEKALVLLWFRLNMLKTDVFFYCVFVQTC